ncbi:MAG: hypothetical protein UW73_C0003G0087 [Microgenomates group bacterium GW2011_GWB1_44_8]|nr:MAG: hypothetical protein UW73_C0003G0087 [Microgenomates group bacterium GW2011_GWB1_44_8]
MIIGLLLAVAAGGLTGYLLNGKGLGATGNSNNSSGAAGEATSVKSAGINDKTAFPDCAQGQLEKGGLKDEGTHHLVRGGGPNQTAYLISSVVDLEAFSGKMVELCGKSIASKKAPWLMDVGYIATIE